MSDLQPCPDSILMQARLRTPVVNTPDNSRIATTKTVVGRTTAVASGLVAGATALGIGELFGSFRRAWQSPVVGVAGAIIERVPRSVKDFGVRNFGTDDKRALVIGILAFSVIFAIVLGLVARRRPAVAIGGFVAFAGVGVWGSQQPVNATISGVIPSVVAGTVGILTLQILLRRAGRPSPVSTSPANDSKPANNNTANNSNAASHNNTANNSDAVNGNDAEQEGEGVMAARPERRMFLLAAGGFVAVAAAAAAGGRTLRSRFSASSSRKSVTLPAPAVPLAPATPAVMSSIPGVSSFYTSNADFYRIDTAVEVPQVSAASWELRIHGMVDHEVRLSFDDLRSRTMVEEDITLTCVSNTVGGNLTGTARWLGVRLKDLLAEAGVHPAANQLVGRSVDGWTSGFPIAALDDKRPALLAIGMNGEPLPLEHGFPARVIVSGLYGYVSATKWITELEVTTFDAFDAYWVQRKWDQQAPIKTQARIDTPRTLANVKPGTVNIGGVAWDQTIGISKVEVKIDSAEFVEATLAAQLTVNTWRLWSFAWTDATPGRHRITVRATDANGVVQTQDRADPFPNGASGWMSIFVDVGEA